MAEICRGFAGTVDEILADEESHRADPHPGIQTQGQYQSPVQSIGRRFAAAQHTGRAAGCVLTVRQESHGVRPPKCGDVFLLQTPLMSAEAERLCLRYN